MIKGGEYYSLFRGFVIPRMQNTIAKQYYIGRIDVDIEI
jgi:hypothetical protein